MRRVPVDRWRLLGRLLPRDVRERIFEPALGDLARAFLERPGSRALPFALGALGTLLGCALPALRHPFVRQGRLTRLGTASLWAVTVGMALVLFVLRIRQGYGASYGP